MAHLNWTIPLESRKGRHLKSWSAIVKDACAMKRAVVPSNADEHILADRLLKIIQKSIGIANLKCGDPATPSLILQAPTLLLAWHCRTLSSFAVSVQPLNVNLQVDVAIVAQDDPLLAASIISNHGKHLMHLIDVTLAYQSLTVVSGLSPLQMTSGMNGWKLWSAVNG